MSHNSSEPIFGIAMWGECKLMTLGKSKLIFLWDMDYKVGNNKENRSSVILFFKKYSLNL